VASPDETGVLVVGGGPVGLVASALLSQHRIPNLVVERRLETQRAPAAHVLRRRPMRVLGRLGVEAAIRRAAPALPLHYITWCASLGGAEAGRLDLREGLPPGEQVWTNCPQNLLEPILLERASREPAARVLRGVECIALEQHAGGVSARLRAGDGERTVRARWALAADGAGSPTRRALGIPMRGPGPQGRMFMVHFEADLRPWLRERPGPICWILHPEAGGALIVHDPRRSHVFMTLRDGSPGERERLPARLAAALGVPARARILSVDDWSPHVQVAARYREGRVFLVGDAAHRFPPTGGLGLNTGILEVENLVAKLARVEAGADPALLDAYAAECRPAAEANARTSYENMLRLGEIPRVIGGQRDLAALERRLASLSAEERDRLAAAIEAQRSHFLWEGQPPVPDRRGQGSSAGVRCAYSA
jgi:2,4-dichlorophenol 6-monooxygenase